MSRPLKDYCELCGSTFMLQNHHIIYGRGNRKICDKYDELQITLCWHCHHDSKTGVHHNKVFDDALKAWGQKQFQKKYSYEFFMEKFRRNYL